MPFKHRQALNSKPHAVKNRKFWRCEQMFSFLNSQTMSSLVSQTQTVTLQGICANGLVDVNTIPLCLPGAAIPP